MTAAEGNWVELCTLASDIEAGFAEGRLEAEGIACTLESLKYHAEPVNLGLLSEIRVHVREQDLEAARAVMARIENLDYATDDDATIVGDTEGFDGSAGDENGGDDES